MLLIRSSCLLIIFMLSGCAGLNLVPQYEKPEVVVSSFRMLPVNGITPKFEIGLRIVNPNNIPLPLRGLAYTVSIDGHKLITGVSNNLPQISAYGEEDVILTAVPNLLGGVGLVTDLIGSRRQEMNYNLRVKLDVGSIFPAILVEKSGKIPLSSSKS